MARRRRKCLRVTEERAIKSIEQRFKMLPYQSEINETSATSSSSSSTSLSVSNDLKPVSFEQKRQTAAVVVPLNSAKKMPVFGEFDLKPVKYSTDFLLKSVVKSHDCIDIESVANCSD